MNAIKNIILFILSLQEKFLMKSLQKTLNAKKKKGRRKHYSNGCLLSIESFADDEKQKMEEEISLILKKTNYNPQEILNYIKAQNTEVYYIKNSKSLYSIGENEGFIYPQKGGKALYLSLLTTKKIRFKTKEMFILSKGEINKHYFIYHFYNWYAFKHGIEGLDTESQELLKKYLFSANEEDYKKLQLADIYKLKDAIKQDKSAIEFVVKLCRNIEGAKQASDKITKSGAKI